MTDKLTPEQFAALMKRLPEKKSGSHTLTSIRAFATTISQQEYARKPRRDAVTKAIYDILEVDPATTTNQIIAELEKRFCIKNDTIKWTDKNGLARNASIYNIKHRIYRARANLRRK